MQYVDEFRDPQRARALLQAIDRLASQIHQDRPGPLKIMEICGGHTHTIFKFGLERLLPATVELVHGPGCPVCIMPRGRMDDAIALAQQPSVILASFGDAMRVPGRRLTLLEARAQGADIRLVYSPLDALSLAQAHPDRRVVFLALGFETTAPGTALTLLQAQDQGIGNFFILSNHVLVLPALEALLSNPDLHLDGFIGPGHVSVVTGTQSYQVIPGRYGKPMVISGFEPLDILQSVWMVLKQLAEGRCQVENQYSRLVQSQGNQIAQQAMAAVFERRHSFEWRGLGAIPASGLKLQSSLAAYDAEVQFDLPGNLVADHRACACGDILRGVKKPWDCRVFGTACTPETPLGACMVSSEGACAAYYRYGRLAQITSDP
ncbi:MAG: hydrogenase formation protein HypD [Cyanobacteria bacterium REEB459]|nr:hydrogenase formation protein HypD [Cyanobacteria bacterium REEB459]